MYDHSSENNVLVLVRNAFTKRLDNGYLADRHTMKRLRSLSAKDAGEYLAANPSTRIQWVES